MYYPDFTIKRGDTQPAIEAVLVDTFNNAIDLTGHSVRFRMRSYTTGDLIFDHDADVAVDQISETGHVTYQWRAGETDGAGYYAAEWYNTTISQTFPTIGTQLLDIEDDVDSEHTFGFNEIQNLRVMVAEPNRDMYSDTALDAMLVRNGGDMNVTAAEIWREKAAQAAHYVDVGTGSSARKMSQLFDRFIKQAELYEGGSGTGGGGGSTDTGRPSIVRPIERP
jgi:hypothetical protein